MNNKNQLIKRLKERAKKKGQEVYVTPQDLTNVSYCPILGIKLDVNHGLHGGRNNSPSLDRKDNSLGYTKDNVWIISNLANQMKSSASPDQLRSFAKWVINEYGID